MASGDPGLPAILQSSQLLIRLIEAAEQQQEPGHVPCIADAIKAGVGLTEPMTTTLDLWRRLELVLIRCGSMYDYLHVVVVAHQVGRLPIAEGPVYPWAEQAKLDYLARMYGKEPGEVGQAAKGGLMLFKTLKDRLEDFQL